MLLYYKIGFSERGSHIRGLDGLGDPGFGVGLRVQGSTVRSQRERSRVTGVDLVASVKEDLVRHRGASDLPGRCRSCCCADLVGSSNRVGLGFGVKCLSFSWRSLRLPGSGLGVRG